MCDELSCQCDALGDALVVIHASDSTADDASQVECDAVGGIGTSKDIFACF